ncbi:hypothetical protein PMO31116_01265 [Pandoraea morbifera]|uniref:DUF2783 domain-containing protein n=1 Tax=Pandoraea morbifera TaxID=2508300 RepID=A0A5E4TAJ5_9BURK|nr:DUF2783 domain-containing protein [Pandoraea morbifera]VVD84471.1 hypothetical protein PMO31116_01265 [Pandoraea morbifera]
MTTPHTDIAGLEAIYDALALAIDDAPDDERERLLAKVALLLANEIQDAPRVLHLIEQAARSTQH